MSEEESGCIPSKLAAKPAMRGADTCPSPPCLPPPRRYPLARTGHKGISSQAQCTPRKTGKGSLPNPPTQQDAARESLSGRALTISHPQPDTSQAHGRRGDRRGAPIPGRRQLPSCASGAAPLSSQPRVCGLQEGLRYGSPVIPRRRLVARREPQGAQQEGPPVGLAASPLPLQAPGRGLQPVGCSRSGF